MNLRSDPSTLAARCPHPFAGVAGERAASVVAGAVDLGSSPGPPGRRRQVGARAHASRRGARNPPEAAPPKAASFPGPVPFTRRCSAHAARIRKESGSFPPPRRRVIERTVLAAKAATPPRGGRGEGRQKAWLLGVISRPSPAGLAPLTRACATRSGSKRPAGGNKRWRASGWVPARAGLPARSPSRRATVVEANADGGGSLARRRIHGSRACPRVEHALQRSVAQSLPRETLGTSPASRRSDGTVVGVGSVEGEHLGRHRKMPARALATTNDCPSDPFVNVHGGLGSQGSNRD
jgi:hypothetical protein